jgi:hypothetical protein
MTSTDHYLEAERLLEHAASMLSNDLHPQDSAELVARQAVIVAVASAHAALAGLPCPDSARTWTRPVHKPGAAPPGT